MSRISYREECSLEAIRKRWKYVQAQNDESFGIMALKGNGYMQLQIFFLKQKFYTHNFKIVFTPHFEKEFTLLQGTPFPQNTSGNGVFTLLDRIDVTNSSRQTYFLEDYCSV